MFFAVGETYNPEDQEFFLKIYEHFKRIIFYTVKKYVCEINTVEDLVQDVIVKLIQKIEIIRQMSKKAQSAYIVHTARNTSINHLKRQQIVNQHHTSIELDDEIDLENILHFPSAEEIVLLNERKDEFHKILEKLAAKDRDVLIGKYLLGLTDKELADLCACKPDSVRMVLTRARRNALEVMKKEAFGYDNA